MREKNDTPTQKNDEKIRISKVRKSVRVAHRTTLIINILQFYAIIWKRLRTPLCTFITGEDFPFAHIPVCYASAYANAPATKTLILSNPTPSAAPVSGFIIFAILLPYVLASIPPVSMAQSSRMKR